MRALTWHGTYDVRVDDVPDPTIGAMAELDISIPRSRDAGQFARNAIGPIADWLPADKAHDLALVISELVNNAEHGAGPITVRIHPLPYRIASSVCDDSVGFTAPQDNSASGGWGLSIVDQLTRRWGGDPTRVWFELVIP
jgi:two-component sensor histidine kinase